MKKVFLLLIFCIAIASQVWAQTARWQQQADFDITVSLNDTKHTLDAFETIHYFNNSPDTLHFIWFHLWMNAYKNDKTAFSEQMTERLDNSEFYYSNEEDRGYINKLDFKVNGQTATLEDHPQYIDVAKLLLPKPLPPGAEILISTPFHEKLPKNFSRGGHVGQSYQITQWFPKPAVYDYLGWHEMPYLDQGEFYSDFGNYKVAITLPKNYVVAATGEVLEQSEKEFLLSRNNFNFKKTEEPTKRKELFAKKLKIEVDEFPVSSTVQKTIHFNAKNVIDFAWFADKRFLVLHDSLRLPTNPHIDAFTFVLPSKKEDWKYSATWVKRAVQFYSNELGDYPYPVVSAVCGPRNSPGGGMEYPNISLINVRSGDDENLDITLAHEVGHNWLQGMIATNERDHAWMDEGINTYYEKKYTRKYYSDEEIKKSKDFFYSADPGERLLKSQIENHKDQALETTSEEMTQANYAAVAYSKGALFMEKMEKDLGKETMKKTMQKYFDQWHFHHPYPDDLQKIAEQISGKNLDGLFLLLKKTGELDSSSLVVPAKVSAVFPKQDGKAKYTSIGPALGFNNYDKLMIGAYVHNLNIPSSSLHYAVAPMYASGSGQFNFIGALVKNFYPKKNFQRISPSITFARFNTANGIGLNYDNLYRGFTKFVPSIRFVLKKKTAVSTIEKWIEWKTYFITEGTFDYKQRRPPQDTFLYFAVHSNDVHRTVNQITYQVENNRHLYPYKMQAQLQQVGDLIRATVNGNYFFNYNANKQGMNIRFFAGKIFYTKTSTDKTKFDNSNYQLSMYGANGTDDYTYSNPFAERNQSQGFFGRQIMIKDGGFKYRSDYSSSLPGRSDNWLVSANFTFDMPQKINPFAVLPFNIPLKVFADIGTSAPAWIENSNDPKFLYSIGFQLPILKRINLYWTILQSSQFDEPNGINGTKWWQKSVSFSIDVQNIKPEISGINLW